MFDSLKAEDPFPFEKLHVHLKQTVIEKVLFLNIQKVLFQLLFEELLTLSQCNKVNFNACWSKTFHATFNVYAVTVRPKQIHVILKNGDTEGINWNIASLPPARISAETLSIHDELSSKKLQKMVRQFKKNKAQVEKISILGQVTCKPDELILLFEVLKSRSLEANHFIKQEFLKEHFFQSLASLNLKRCALTDNPLLCMRSPYLKFISSQVTDEAINRFLKQWLHGQRKMESVSIGWYSTNQPRDYAVVFADIDANPIWTYEDHDDSLLGFKPPHDIFDYLLPPAMYSIWNPADISDNRIIRCSRREIEITRGGEAKELYKLLPPRFSYVVSG